MLLKPNVVSLSVGGKLFRGWETITITRALEALCGTFEVSLTDRQDGQNFSLLTQSEVEVRIDDDLVLTGYVDAVDLSIDGQTHTVTIRGRDRTCDLVDCSIPLPLPSVPSGSDVFAYMAKLALVHSIKSVSKVEVQKSTEMIKAIEGETPAEAIIRLCKDRGWIPTTSPRGELVITASGNAKAHDELTHGVNVLAAQARYDYTNRFHKYTLTGQRTGSLADLADTFGGSLTFKSSFTDTGVKRVARELIFAADSAANPSTLKKRAQVEALVRAAASQVVEVTVQGWRQSNNDVWAPNLVVSCKIPPLYLDQQMLITEVTFMLNEGGTTCRMRLKRPDAFNPGTSFKVSGGATFKSTGSTIKAQKSVGFDAF